MSEPKTVTGAYQKIESHEELCAERYRAINETLAEVKASVRGHGKAAWGILLAMLGWMALQVWNGHAIPPAPVVVAQATR